MQISKEPDLSAGSRKTRLSLWLAISIVFAAAWLVVSPYYYNRVLDGRRIDLMVHCDASVLNSPDIAVFVFYDQAVLSPPAKILGIFQARPPDKVRSFFPMRLFDFEIKKTRS